MTDYVQYHNADDRGYECQSIEEPVVYANKLPQDIIGARIWLVQGRTVAGLKGKRYSLCYVFEATHVEPSADPGFKHQVLGKLVFRGLPPVPLSGEPWIKGFLKSVTNFSRGITRLEELYVDHFETVLPAS